MRRGDRRDVGKVRFASAIELRVGEFFEQNVRLAVADPMPLLDRGEADRLGEVALPRARRRSHILRSFRDPSSSTMRGTPSSGSA
jgi:hypothetical protein